MRTVIGGWILSLGLVSAWPGPLLWAQTSAPSLDQLLQDFSAEAPVAKADVHIEARIEAKTDGDGTKSLVVTLIPEGETRLIADPGITITSPSRPGIEWLGAMPHRHMDDAATYFETPPIIALPFTASDHEMLAVNVEYAYCLVDIQCFFGEETLTLAAMPEG